MLLQQHQPALVVHGRQLPLQAATLPVIFLITVFPKRTPAFATGSAAAVTAAPPVARHARRSGSRARLPVIQRAPVRRRALPAHKTAFVVAGFLPSCARTTSKHSLGRAKRVLWRQNHRSSTGEELCPFLQGQYIDSWKMRVRSQKSRGRVEALLIFGLLLAVVMTAMPVGTGAVAHGIAYSAWRSSLW
jgi:hypothetical protein